MVPLKMCAMILKMWDDLFIMIEACVRLATFFQWADNGRNSHKQDFSGF